MITRLHRKKTTPAEELVPVDQDTLRALIDEDGRSISALAAAAGASQQRLSALLTPKVGKRAHRGFVEALALVLGLSPQLLMGERVAFLGANEVADGAEYRYSRRTELAAQRLVTQIMHATQRDVTERVGSLDDLRALLVYQQTARSLVECILIHDWRQRLLVWPPGTFRWTEPMPTGRPFAAVQTEMTDGTRGRRGLVPEQLIPRSAPKASVELVKGKWVPLLNPGKDPNHEAAVLGLIRALEHCLRPWFDGTAELNYRAVRDLVHLPQHPFATVTEFAGPTDPRAILDPQVLAPTPPFAPPAPKAPTPKAKAARTGDQRKAKRSRQSRGGKRATS